MHEGIVLFDRKSMILIYLDNVLLFILPLFSLIIHIEVFCLQDINFDVFGVKIISANYDFFLEICDSLVI